MKTTTKTTQATAARPPLRLFDDSLRVSSIKLGSRFQLQDPPAERVAMTTVEITPNRAPLEITRAIRRQRQAAGIMYSRDLESSRSEFKVVLGESFHPDTTQFIVTSSHCVDSLGPADVRSGTSHDSDDHSPGHQTGNIRGNGRSRPSHSARENYVNSTPGMWGHIRSSCSATWSRQGAVSTDNHKQSATTDSSYGYQGWGNAVSQHKDNTPDTAMTSNNGDITTTKAVEAAVIYIQDESSQKSGNTKPDASSSFVKSVGDVDNLDRQNQHTSSMSMLAANTGILPRRNSRNFTSSSLQRSTTMLPQSIRSRHIGVSSSLRPAYLQAMPCVQFADSVLKCVGSNLNNVYKLCQSKMRYYEYFENSKAEKFLDGHRAVDHNKKAPRGFARSDLALPRTPQLPLLKSTTMAWTLTQQSSLPQPPESLASPQTEVSALTSSPRPTWSKQGSVIDNSLVEGETSGAARDEDFEGATESASISGTQVVTANIRSILKTGKGCWDDRGSSSDSSVSRSTTESATSSCHTLPDATITAATLLAVARETREPFLATADFGSKDKGRLVRFSAHHKIHEFTSLDPVVWSYNE